jgi:hypothetical protein
VRDVGGEAVWAEESVRVEEDEAMVFEKMCERELKKKNVVSLLGL